MYTLNESNGVGIFPGYVTVTRSVCQMMQTGEQQQWEEEEERGDRGGRGGKGEKKGKWVRKEDRKPGELLFHPKLKDFPFFVLFCNVL